MVVDGVSTSISVREALYGESSTIRPHAGVSLTDSIKLFTHEENPAESVDRDQREARGIARNCQPF